MDNEERMGKIPDNATVVRDAEKNVDEPAQLDALIMQHNEEVKTEDLPVEPPSDVPNAPALPLGNQHLKSNGLTVVAGWDNFRLAPADRTRKEMHLVLISDTATDFLVYASDVANLNTVQAARVYAGAGNEVVLTDYQGEIWVGVPSGFTGPGYLGYVAVAE